MDEKKLQQDSEFLRLQLEDSLAKERRLQQMYDLLLASVSQPTQEQQVDVAALARRHEAELAKLAEDYEVKTRHMIDELKQARDAQRESEFSLRTQKLSYEESLLELRQQIYQLNNDKSHLTMKVKLLTSSAPTDSSETLKAQIKSLTRDLEQTKVEYKRSVTETSEHSQRMLGELKEIYEEEKKKLTEQIAKLQSDLANQREVIEEELEHTFTCQLQERLETLYHQAQEELEAMRTDKALLEEKCKNLDMEVCTLRSDLNTRAAKIEEQRHFIWERMEKTKQILKFAATAAGDLQKLKTQVSSLKETIGHMEDSEKSWQGVVSEKERQISVLKLQVDEQNMRIAQLAVQVDEQLSPSQSRTQVDELQDLVRDLRLQLAEKESALSWAKRRQQTSDCSPRFRDQVSPEELKLLQTYRKMVSAATAMECEYCRRTLTTQTFAEHLQECKADSSEGSEEVPGLLRQLDAKDESRVEELEKALYELRISQGEMKNARDRAKLDCEKLLIQLKHAKLDWAMAEQRTSERELDTKRQVQAILAGLQTLRERVSEDVDQIVQGLMEIARDCLARGFKSKSGFSTPLGFAEREDS